MHRYDLSGARVSGPLAELAAGYSAYLTSHGYAAVSVCHHLRLMADVSVWLGEQGLKPGQLSPEAAGRFAGTAGRRRTYLATARALAPMLEYLRDAGVLPEPDPPPADAQAALLAGYRQYLRAERGLAEVTIANYVTYAAEFAAMLGDPLDEQLAGLAGAQVLGIVSAQARQRRPPSAGAVMNAARAFLRFLHHAAWIPQPLAPAVPVAARRALRLPRRLDAAAAAALLGSCDRGTEAGLRDYAVLTLLRRYGARGIEISRLTLPDLRWRAGEIVLRGKAGRIGVLPLMHDAGEALAACLLARRAQPPGTSQVFLTVHAPARPLHRATVNGIVARACQRAGIAPAGPRAFRHALGCGLLTAGAALADIRDVLRHEDIATTSGYARADLAALAPLVRPWPAAGQAAP